MNSLPISRKQNNSAVLFEMEEMSRITEGKIVANTVLEFASSKIKFVSTIAIEKMRQSTKYCAVHDEEFIPFIFWGFAVERMGDSAYPMFFFSQPELFSYFHVSSFDELSRQLSKETSKYLISLWGRVVDTKNLQTLFYYQPNKNWVFGLSKTSVEFWSVIST